MVRDILVISSHTASGLKNDRHIRSLQHSLCSKAASASESLRSLGWRAIDNRETVAPPELIEPGAGKSAHTAGRKNAMELLKREVQFTCYV